MSTFSNDDDESELAADETLRAAYVRVTKHQSPHNELRAGVREFVAHLRSAAMPPEKVLIRLKRVLANRPGAIRDSRTVDTRSALHEQIIRWGIEEYYRTQSL